MTDRSVLVIGDAGSPHVYRWCGFLRDIGCRVGLLTYGRRDGYGPGFDYGFCDYIDRSSLASAPRLTAKFASLLFFFRDLVFLRTAGYRLANLQALSLRWATAILLSSRSGPAWLITCWGSDVLKRFASSRGLARFVYRKALERATAITCDSESVRQAILKHAPAIPPDKIRLVYWGVDTRQFRPASGTDRAEARSKLGLPRDCVVGLSLRGLYPNYAVLGIIETFSRNCTDARNWLLVHVSPQRDEAYYGLCREAAAGCERIVFHAGALSNEDMHILYWAADLCLHFPRSDATAISILEGLACGNAIVCSDAVEAYASLADRYAITRISLDELGDDVFAKVAAPRTEERAANLRALAGIHSREASLRDLESLMETI